MKKKKSMYELAVEMLEATNPYKKPLEALPWTPHEMENARHPFELPPIHYTVIRASMQQMGIAGDDSWGSRTHPEYLLDVNVSKKMSFTFRFHGI